jgi:ribosomal protein S18 acetylase RimI-like enzyme
MTSIIKANAEDFQLLADIGKISFIESHGSSANEEVIEMYIKEKFNYDVFKEELSSPENIYHIIFYGNQPAGYSKIILNSSHPGIPVKNVTKLERIYLLKEFYSLKLGAELFEFNLKLSKQQNQDGMWLFVWKENHRAISFYKKNKFKIIGSYDFKLTETYANPNHQMFLKY